MATGGIAPKDESGCDNVRGWRYPEEESEVVGVNDESDVDDDEFSYGYGTLGNFYGFGGFRRREYRLWKPGDDFLKSRFHFPSFRNLPHENDIPDGYFVPDYRGVYVIACVWFFMGEIVNDEFSQISFLRNKVYVKDREGSQCPIYFYPERGYFDFKSLKKGCTILVTNGQQHNFLDLSVGLRIENLATVGVAPCEMSHLLKLSDSYYTRKDASCWCCGKQDALVSSSPKQNKSSSSSSSATTAAASATTAAASATTAAASATTATASAITAAASATTAAAVHGSVLKKCAACKMARYCSKECQKKDWALGHKKSCKAVPLFQKLTQIDFNKVDDRSLFHRLPRWNF